MRILFIITKWTITLGLTLVVRISSAQSFEAKYLFIASIVEENGGSDPTYIIQEVDSDPSGITYTSGVDDQAVELDSASGFKLPMEVTDALFASNVWSFKMRFKITDFGAGDGQRQLINLKRSGTGTPPYFSIKNTKNSDTQGRVVFQMEDATTRVQLYAFYFNLDEWVNLSFTIDFANQKFTLK
jgi:hypothetical protein